MDDLVDQDQGRVGQGAKLAPQAGRVFGVREMGRLVRQIYDSSGVECVGYSRLPDFARTQEQDACFPCAEAVLHGPEDHVGKLPRN